MKFSHEWIEKNPWLLIVLVTLVVSVGGAVEIIPLFFQKSTTEPVAGLKPYSALRLTGRDIYVREGCYTCHSQMVRPFRAETERYGHYSVRANSCTTARSSGVPSAPVPTWRAWAAAIPMNGTAPT